MNPFGRAVPPISFAWLLALAVAAPSPDAAHRIQGEIARLQQALKDKPVSDPNFAQAGALAAAALQSAARAADANRLYLSLEKLALAQDLVGDARAIVDKTASMKAGLPAFEPEWGAASFRLTALDKEAHGRR